MKQKKETISTKNKYEAYGIIESLDLSKEDLLSAVTLMERILLKSDTEERKEKYLFDRGAVEAREIYLKRKEDYDSLSFEDKVKFKIKEENFEKKMGNIEPLVKFILKIKEVLHYD